ncbi:MAG TPA: ATP-binding protein, partial [Acidimicrobiia bacterium]
VVAELFDRYRSGDKPEGLPSSTGIGLWLSRALARLMGGDVHHLGGSAFEVVLPAALPLEGAVGF